MNNIADKTPLPKPEPTPLPDTFGGYLRGLRRGRGVTQRELAKRAGVDFTYISKLENDRALGKPSEPLCKAIAKALDVDEWEVCLRAEKLPSELVEWLLEMSAEELRGMVTRQIGVMTRREG